VEGILSHNCSIFLVNDRADADVLSSILPQSGVTYSIYPRSAVYVLGLPRMRSDGCVHCEHIPPLQVQDRFYPGRGQSEPSSHHPDQG